MVDVDRIDARGPQGVALQVQRLGAIRLRDAGVADQHVSQTVVWDMRARAASGERLHVSYAMSHSVFCIRPVKENGTENRPDQPAEVGPVCPSATRGGPAAPLHPERRRPAEHRGPAASPQQAGLRAEVIAASQAGRRAGTLLIALFGTLALVLVVAGVYSVITQAIVQRQLELAVRSALGARPAQVIALAMRTAVQRR